mgnify:CR=1 FL=1
MYRMVIIRKNCQGIFGKTFLYLRTNVINTCTHVVGDTVNLNLTKTFLVFLINIMRMSIRNIQQIVKNLLNTSDTHTHNIYEKDKKCFRKIKIFIVSQTTWVQVLITLVRRYRNVILSIQSSYTKYQQSAYTNVGCTHLIYIP